MGDTSEIEVLGKTMRQWIMLALGNSYCDSIPYTESVALPLLLRPYIRKDSEYTVVLFSDTPLITRKTVLDAVFELAQSRENVLKMTRGFVFRTQYLLTAERVYTENHRYFDEEDFLTAFSFKQVAMVSDVMRNRILGYHMSHGVQFEDPSSCFVGCDAVIGRGTVVAPFNIIKGKSVIREGVTLGAGNYIENSTVGEGCYLEYSKVIDSSIGKRSSIGPYAQLRGDVKVGEGCRIGNFVELKKSAIGDGTKIAHLSYVGDATVGKNCNIGCGVVFCNYDGVNKHPSTVGDNVFIGSNSSLVAPITIGNGAFIAAGSTVTDSVPDGALAVARSKQTIKNDWINRNKGENNVNQ